MTLPSPGPGRPDHLSYREPGPMATITELITLVVGLPALVLAVEFLAGAVS